MGFFKWIRLPLILNIYVGLFLTIGLFFFFSIIIVLHESFHTNQGVCFEKKIDSDNNAN